MYSSKANPGVHFRYRQLRCGDWWDEDPASPTYSSFPARRLRNDAAFRGRQRRCGSQPRPYPYLAVVEYNMRPVVPGKGSRIFLHAQTGGPTIGCISLRKSSCGRCCAGCSPPPRP